MFFIFSVLPIKDILKILNRLVNEYLKGVFNNLSCTRQSVTENTFIKVEVISPRKRSSQKVSKQKLHMQRKQT